EKTAAWTTALASPGMNLEWPHAREDDSRIVWIHLEMSATAVFVGEEHAFPRLAAVGCTKHTAFLLWSISMAQRTHEHHVGILRIDNNATDAARLFQAHQHPRLARVSGFVNSLADGDM